MCSLLLWNISAGWCD
ncbi:hypothetical protein [Acinetobacter baumannii]|nr:hypothetical protein [Acinetobacter baumannii]